MNEAVELNSRTLTIDDYPGYGAKGEFLADLKDFKEGKICGARNSSNKMCRNRPDPNSDNGRCKHHGSRVPVGQGHYKYKHGLYSKYVPSKLMKRYKSALNNADLISLHEEIALTRIRISELIENLPEGGSVRSFDKLYKAYDEVQNTSPGADSYEQKVNTYHRAMEEMRSDIDTWDEIYRAEETLKRLIQQEHKKMEFNQQYVEVDKVVNLMSRLLNLVKREIEGMEGMLLDEEQIKKSVQRIANEFQKAAE